MIHTFRVAIVVINYNGFQYSKECIESLQHIDYHDCTIVFVDNGSQDGSGQQIQELFEGQIVYLSLPENLGVTGGNNAGIDFAISQRFDFVLLINNDTLVEPAFLNHLLQTSVEHKRALVAPKIICYFDQDRVDHWIGETFNWWTGRPKGYTLYPLGNQAKYNQQYEVTVASTCCLLVPIEVFERIGKMDERYFMYYDDADFTLRASRSGCKIMYQPEAIIYHKCNMTTKNQQPADFEYYLTNRNFIYFYQKLCPHPLIKSVFFFKEFMILFLQYLNSYRKKNPKRRKIIQSIMLDIWQKRMGPPQWIKASSKNILPSSYHSIESK